MKITSYKKNAENILKRHEDWLASLEGMTDEEREKHLPGPVTAGAILDAKRALELVNIYKQMKKEDRERLNSIPAYSTDWRPLADIKEAYGVSWNELKTMAAFEPDNTQQKYDAANTVQFKMKLNKKTDADILAQLEKVENKQGYIKALIRKDIENNK